MLSKNQKRIMLVAIDVLFSAFIWSVNASWGNTFSTCLILSTTTFLIVFTPFEIYWSFQDLWFDRWIDLYLPDVKIIRVQIPVEAGTLSADLVIPEGDRIKKTRNSIVVICHGFSDTKKKLQYYYFPIAYQGYSILAYDARGSGESKGTGKKSQFLERINDFNSIVKWIKNDYRLKTKNIYAIGMSVGAITALCAGFPNKVIEKIVAISSMSYYKQNMPKRNAIIMLKYFLKGVPLFPTEDANKKLSPYLVIEQVKNQLSKEDWNEFSKKVLLIHTKNDKVIKINNFYQNRSLLESSKEIQLVLRKGGHSQKKNELILVGASLDFFSSP